MKEERPRRLKRVVIKEELVALCDDDPLEAVVLGQMLYWGERIQDADRFIQEEISRSLEGGEHEPPALLHGWIYKSAEELAEEIMIGKRAAVADRLKNLQARGFLVMRKNPRHRWDRTNQYRLEISAIQRALQVRGYALEGYALLKDTLPTPTPQTPSSPTATTRQSTAINGSSPTSTEWGSIAATQQSNTATRQAIPETTTKTTHKKLEEVEEDTRDFLPQNAQPPKPDPYQVGGQLKGAESFAWRDLSSAQDAELLEVGLELASNHKRIFYLLSKLRIDEKAAGSTFHIWLPDVLTHIRAYGAEAVEEALKTVMQTPKGNIRSTRWGFYLKLLKNPSPPPNTNRAASNKYSGRDVKENTSKHEEEVDMAAILRDLPSEGTWGRR